MASENSQQHHQDAERLDADFRLLFETGYSDPRLSGLFLSILKRIPGLEALSARHEQLIRSKISTGLEVVLATVGHNEKDCSSTLYMYTSRALGYDNDRVIVSRVVPDQLVFVEFEFVKGLSTGAVVTVTHTDFGMQRYYLDKRDIVFGFEGSLSQQTGVLQLYSRFPVSRLIARMIDEEYYPKQIDVSEIHP